MYLIHLFAEHYYFQRALVDFLKQFNHLQEMKFNHHEFGLFTTDRFNC